MRSQALSERGAALVVGLFVVLILLAIGALVVDVPRMERVGRLLQRAADAAALAGAAELNSEVCRNARFDPDLPPDPVLLDILQTCWKRAKRAAFYYLSENPVYTAESVSIPLDSALLEPHAVTGQNPDPHDTTGLGYQYELFEFQIASGRTLQVQVTRMLYTRGQGKWSAEVPQTIVPQVERGTIMDGAGLCTTDPRCGSRNPPSYRWANGMHIRLTLTGFPSILAQLPAIGIPATSTIVREGFAAPHHTTTEWP